MKHLIALIVLTLASAQAMAGTALWTGRAEQVTTVSYQIVWRCEYNHFGTIFTRLFKTAPCPLTLEME